MASLAALSRASAPIEAVGAGLPSALIAASHYRVCSPRMPRPARGYQPVTTPQAPPTPPPERVYQPITLKLAAVTVRPSFWHFVAASTSVMLL